MDMAQPRKRAGTPTGGQWVPAAHDEPDIGPLTEPAGTARLVARAEGTSPEQPAVLPAVRRAIRRLAWELDADETGGAAREADEALRAVLAGAPGTSYDEAVAMARRRAARMRQRREEEMTPAQRWAAEADVTGIFKWQRFGSFA